MEDKNKIISIEKELKEKIKEIKKQGKEKFHVLADFDRTLTKAFVDGEKTPSVISELRRGDYISKDYAQRAQALFEKYHPIEIDPNIPLEEKKEKMHEWWSSHFNLLIKSGLNKKHLEQIIENGKIQFRKGSLEFFDFLHEKKIPLVIMSSGGLGGDSITMFLEKYGRLYDNVHVISNIYEWDSEGNAVSVKDPIIHTMNKDETIVRKYPIFKEIKDRKNVLLLGDSLGDLGMIKGFDYNTLIKIGFLNDKVEKYLPKYRQDFDVVLLNDTNMKYVNGLLGEIIK